MASDYLQNDFTGKKDPSSSPLFLEFWNQTLNSSDSYGLLYGSLLFFGAGWVYCQSKKQRFFNFVPMHMIHNVSVVGLGAASLLLDNDQYLKERTLAMFSIGYFVVDLMDCLLIEGDVAFTFHAVTVLLLNVANLTNPRLTALRTQSKASLMEFSNPFLNLARKTRKPWHFALFALSFTLCRIVWLPFVMYQLHQDGGFAWHHPTILTTVAFYGLNLYWWYKIGRIIVKGVDKDDKGGRNSDVNRTNNGDINKETRKKKEI